MHEKHIHGLFKAGVTLKGLHGLLELVTGVVTLALGPVAVSDLFFAIAQREWIGGGRIPLVNFLVWLAEQSLRGGQQFVGIYLVAVGLINIVLVIGLLASALWSYPTALAAIALLMAYQLFRYTHTHALALILLTLFDAVVWLLVLREYRVVLSSVTTERQSSYRDAVQSRGMRGSKPAMENTREAHGRHPSDGSWRFLSR
jgi:uncharacterized membrane protein